VKSAIFIAALLAVLGCDEPETPTQSPPAERTPAEPTPSEAVAEPPEIPEPTASQGLMRGHFRHAGEAQDALIRGDMEHAREHMRWLATHDEREALPENVRPLLVPMETEAASFAEATTLTEAGQALGRTLVRCGNCHLEGGGFAVALEPPPGDDTTEEHMQRHQWAATRMWEGLVVADVEQFNAGAAALRGAALHDIETHREAPPERIAAIADLVHDLARQAEGAPDEDARASIYGRFLATCATCHRLLGTGPEAPPEPTTEE